MNKAEEKAKELIEGFGDEIDSYGEYMNSRTHLAISKQCALICVDEMLKEIPMYIGELNPQWNFWQEDKQAIKNK